MSVKDVTKSNFSNLIFHSDKPVVLSFNSQNSPDSRKQDMFLTMYSFKAFWCLL